MIFVNFSIIYRQIFFITSRAHKGHDTLDPLRIPCAPHEPLHLDGIDARSIEVVNATWQHRLLVSLALSISWSPRLAFAYLSPIADTPCSSPEWLHSAPDRSLCARGNIRDSSVSPLRSVFADTGVDTHFFVLSYPSSWSPAATGSPVHCLQGCCASSSNRSTTRGGHPAYAGLSGTARWGGSPHSIGTPYCTSPCRSRYRSMLARSYFHTPPTRTRFISPRSANVPRAFRLHPVSRSASRFGIRFRSWTSIPFNRQKCVTASIAAPLNARLSCASVNIIVLIV